MEAYNMTLDSAIQFLTIVYIVMCATILLTLLILAARALLAIVERMR